MARELPSARPAPRAGYAPRVDSVPAGGPALPSPAARPPGSPPGAKRARYERWKKTTLLVTVLVLVAFGGVATWVLTSWLRESPEDDLVKNGRQMLARLAERVEEYRQVYAHLPQRLSQLRDPALKSDFEADVRDPWYTRIEFLPDEDGKGFRLRSAGPDKVMGTADDLLWPRAGKN